MLQLAILCLLIATAVNEVPNDLSIAADTRSVVGGPPLTVPDPRLGENEVSGPKMASHLTRVGEQTKFEYTPGDTVSGIADSVLIKTASGLNSGSKAQYGMDLDFCVRTLQDVGAQIQVHETEINRLRSLVVASQDRAKVNEGLARRIWEKEISYASELQNVFTLYNDVSVRASVLQGWMNDEKHVRNQLSSVYTALEDKSIKQSEELFGLTSILRAALTRMQTIHDHVSLILKAVANAETVMYEWAFNVTKKVNSQTTNVVNLAQGLEYRITQVHVASREIAKMSQVFMQMTTKYSHPKLLEVIAESVGQYEVPGASNTLPPNAVDAVGSPVQTSPKLVKNE